MAARLLRLRAPVPPGHGYLSAVIVWCCQYMSLRRADHSSRGVLQTVMRLVVCDLETSRMWRPRPVSGPQSYRWKRNHKYHIYVICSTLPLNSSLLGPNILRPLFYLTSCTSTKSNLYLANSLATVESDSDLCWYFTFHVPNLMSLFHCSRRPSEPIQVRSFVIYFVTW